MDIKPVDKDIKELLTSAFYKIPRFQRPYSWDRANVEDFWADSIQTEEEFCFIGSFVVYRRHQQTGDTLLVVDGQQRLTTITLLLAGLRNEFHALGFSALASGLHRWIEREDINNELRYILQSETPYPYFQRHIQAFPPSDSAEKPPGQEEANLKAAFDFLRSRIRGALRAVDEDTTVGEDQKKEEKKKVLTDIRDRLMRLQLILITLDNDEDAYLIFETLNTRGKDLEVADLAKSHITRLLRPTNVGVDTAKDRWEKLRAELEDENLDINGFLLHFWLSRYPYISKRKLFKQFKRRVTRTTAREFLRNLVSDSDLYIQALKPDSFKWKREELPARRALEALSLFRVIQPAPLLLAVLREYRTGGLKLRPVTRVLTRLEDFHVQFTAVTSQRTGGGTAQMYALSARSLVDAPDASSKAEILDEFLEKLRLRRPSYEEFEASFAEIRYVPKQRHVVKYLLTRIDQCLRQGKTSVVVDYSTMTVEHIGARAASQLSAETVHMMGNLLLMSEDSNNRVGTRSFADKKKLYASLHVPMDPILSEATTWTDDDVDERTRRLARILYDCLQA